MDDRARTTPPDTSFPSEQFVGLPDATDAPTVQIYDCLPAILREIDESQGQEFLFRYLRRPQEVWERIVQKIWRLMYLVDFRRCPPAVLGHLLATVGFGPGSGVPEQIADDLDDADKRKLISIAASIWRLRGRRDLLVDLIRVFTGVRGAVYDWFQLRDIVDEMVVGSEAGPADVFMLRSSLLEYEGWNWAEDPVSDGDVYVSVRVPCPLGQQWGGLSRYLLTSYPWPPVAIPPVEGVITIDTVCDLIDLVRPLSERYDVAFVTWLDTFLDGRLGHWVTLAGDSATWVAGQGVEPDEMPQHPHLVLTPGTSEGVVTARSADWEDYVWSSQVYLTTGAEVSLYFYAAVYLTWVVGYLVHVTATHVYLYKVGTGGPTPTLLGSVAWAVAEECWVGVVVDVMPSAGGGNLIRVWVDGDLVLSHAGDSDRTKGSIGVRAETGTADVWYGPAEVFERPLTVVSLTPVPEW